MAMEELNPGDVVETSFGVGVIASCPGEESAFFKVMLWRIPGKSMGSSSTAHIQRDSILGRLPVAPGMITIKAGDPSKRKYMVQAYYASTKLYQIRALEDNDELAANTTNSTAVDIDPSKSNDTVTSERLSRLSVSGHILSDPHSSLISAHVESVSANDLSPSPSAKFYPLLVELIRRGEQTASATTEFLNKDEVTNVLGKASEYTHKQSAEAMAQASSVIPDDVIGSAVDNLATQVKGAVNEDEVQQVMAMIKDEDLTFLLEKGKARLEQLLNKDIPKATEAALENAGIRVVMDEEFRESPYSEAITKSREMALEALDDLLKKAEVDPSDLDSIKESLGENFSTMFDSLSAAAKSDRNLAKILDTLNEQTAEWQEATGRLMSTRSASLFFEGANRIQARAASLFSKDQLQWAGEIGSKFTKAFTEGDAAVARLKSIELGESVRDRLVRAIEIRSESLGGLDGIIAGALTTARSKGGESGDQLKDMLTLLQGQADSASKDANESLISVLSHRNEYRDVALLKLEQVLCELESHLGQHMAPEEIAALARGEGGTSKLFEPIAKRAADEIEKQLGAAEESVTDETMLGVLKHVRKIISGEMTVNAVMDEVVGILNDDNVVAAGENLVKQGEQVLDVIEGVSGNKMVEDALQIAEKAGITKDSVMEGIEKIDVNELLDNAGNAINDDAARQKLLSDATDTALDFILRVLPSMPIPPVDGVKDGLVYHISNLSMEGFKVTKENILVEVAGMRATKKADGAKESGAESSEGGDTTTGRNIRNTSSSMDLDTHLDENAVVNATELLIIDVKQVSAIFNHAMWGFEQTYMPYLKGNGKFDVKMSGGAIRLSFELRKRLKVGIEEGQNEYKPEDWEPVLCLHDRLCTIGSVEFSMQGGSKLAWVINKVASVFKGLLRDYVVKAILQIISNRSGWILSKLNEGLSPFWDVLLRTAKLELSELEIATRDDIIEAIPEKETNLLELVWRERLPLGMNLLLNDESGKLKIVDFPRGSQARSVCEKRNLDPNLFKGSTIVAVNGIRYQNDDDLFEALKDPSRPKTIQFELAESEDAERIKNFVAKSKKDASAEEVDDGPVERNFSTRKVLFTELGDLGIEFANAPDNFGLVIRQLIPRDDGVVTAAERCEDLNEGDLLTRVNGNPVLGADGAGRSKALKLLQEEGHKRPLSLEFSDPYLFRASFKKPEGSGIEIGGPEELKLEEKKVEGTKRVALTGFKQVDGIAEKSGILLGDYLVFVNGCSVGAGCRWLGESSNPTMAEVEGMIKDASKYPIGLTFARPLRDRADNKGWSAMISGGGPKSTAITMENSETVCVAADAPEQLGLVLETVNASDVVVKDLEGVPGPFQSLAAILKDRQTKKLHQSIDAVNGEFVPSFATPQMVLSAMDRSWKSQGCVEVMFCDDQRKIWVQSLQ
ncbi:unnamed protein product [Cylindrotheca closterium]|uniref:PDZ domain-containing protein n=1 Tax=Cylindrotheca closterium TaxID=2856 RepID=A0AAD2CCE8_9STRA|nr:unnamed protein product [Cylindrotheca closterium]